jgi:hypothetical protein
MGDRSLWKPKKCRLLGNVCPSSRSSAERAPWALTRELFPTKDLLLYHDALGRLVGREARLFARRMRGRKVESPQTLLEAAVHLMGELLTRMRRKLILDLIAGFDLGEAASAAPRTARPRRRVRASPR